MHHTLKA